MAETFCVISSIRGAINIVCGVFEHLTMRVRSVLELLITVFMVSIKRNMGITIRNKGVISRNKGSNDTNRGITQHLRMTIVDTVEVLLAVAILLSTGVNAVINGDSNRAIINRNSGVIKALITAIIVLLTTQSSAETNPLDVVVLKELLRNVGGTAKLPTWTGDDPCGVDTWRYVQCDGSVVIGLQLQNARLSGELPASLNKMHHLQTIALQGNNFTGPLPSLSGLAGLQSVYMDFQSFSSIPNDFFAGLVSLTHISLDYSPLNAATDGWTLPVDVAHLKQLETLSLSATHLSGRLPDFLATLPNLQNLHLAYNYLTGSIPASFATASFVSVELNNQQGVRPLSGTIDSIGKMQSLSKLWLQVNAFSGPVPASLGSIPTLQDCRLNDNQFVGRIPASFAMSETLTELCVQHNHLQGEIPSIPSLDPSNFTFAGNSFCSDKIGAKCSAEVEALLDFLEALHYPADLSLSWIGDNPCSSWIGISCNPRTGKVIAINLPGRKLAGTISPSIANLTYLQLVVLSDNDLTGTIPPSLTTLHSLRRLSLRNNNLSPPVPSLPGVITDISGNPNFIRTRRAAPAPSSGTSSSIPTTPSTSASPSAPDVVIPGFTGLSPPAAAPMELTDGAVELAAKRTAAGPVIGGVFGTLCGAAALGLLAFFLIKERKKKQRTASVPSTNSTVTIHPAGSGSDHDPEVLKFTVAGNRADSVASGEVAQSVQISGDGVQTVEAGNLLISIQVLRNVTDNFSHQNVLGSGGFGVVYKGELDDGTKIAVKRMEASVVSKGLKEFQSEIAVLTNVRHRHLVSLLGYCIHGTERLLVYEYMPLGNLSQHLFEFEKLGLQPLCWKHRLSIALDVARGMEYLHTLAHGGSFIHRDLKSSNILLGDDYRAKVSDFGLVKLATEGKNSVETRLAGTFGYLAPEYAVTGRVTTKSDVFSFGVVLMELISGRKALDDTQPEESVHLVAWFKRQTSSGKDEDLRSAIDKTVLQESQHPETLQSIKVVSELAGHCASREAWHRPDMSHAVNVLSPLVEKWKPTDVDGDEAVGIDLDMTLPQALRKWQAYEEGSTMSTFVSNSCLDITNGSMPSRPAGFADSFTSMDGR